MYPTRGKLRNGGSIMKWLKRIGIAVGVLVVLVAAGVTYLQLRPLKPVANDVPREEVKVKDNPLIAEHPTPSGGAPADLPAAAPP